MLDQSRQALRLAFARELRRCIQADGRSYSAIGRSVGMEASMVSQWIRGRHIPRVPIADLLIDALGNDADLRDAYEAANATRVKAANAGGQATAANSQRRSGPCVSCYDLPHRRPKRGCRRCGQPYAEEPPPEPVRVSLGCALGPAMLAEAGVG